jgi:hypothetical protein
MKGIRRSWALVILGLFLVRPTIGAEAKHTYFSGYVGHPPADARLRARTYFNDPRIEELVREIAARGGASLARVEQAVSGTSFSVEDLLRVKILRREGDEFHIGFNFFTAEDMRRVAAAVDQYTPLLVQAFLSRAAEFARIYDRYPVKSVDARRLAFVLIAGFSLNWDGLAISARRGYRKPVTVDGDGWRYGFWASEELPGHDTHEFYWGSSTFPAPGINLSRKPVDYSFSSFGDPYSDPRMSFPDLFLLGPGDLSAAVREIVQSVGTVHETALGFDCPDVLGFERLRDVGEILFTLRSGPKSEEELGRELSAKSLGPLLSLLQEIQYVEKDGRGRFDLLIPVLDDGDRRMVRESLDLSARILEQWLADCYPNLRRDLGPLTSLRQGMPFESLFTQIWHEFFGRTTRDLVRSGFLFDPAGPDVRYKRSFPALWRSSLYHLEYD